MSLFVGIDTSNYTTSVALYESETDKIVNCKKLLDVSYGQKGLMQSNALFAHIRQLPEVLEAAFCSLNGYEKISAVAVSEKPRMVEGSYMPVFLAGVSVASGIACSCGVPLYKTAHQIGHIVSALYSAKRLDLLGQKFIAFHVSGGTTEALLCTPDDENIINCEIVADSLDLKAGQAIDRVGVMLGLKFPCGAQLDILSQNGKCKMPKPTLKGANCCISGLENQCEKMMKQGEKPENISRYAIEYIYQTIFAMTNELKRIYGDLPILYAGGVMSNSYIRENLTKNGGIFCEPDFSSDNAAGVAYLSYLKYNKENSIG